VAIGSVAGSSAMSTLVRITIGSPRGSVVDTRLDLPGNCAGGGLVATIPPSGERVARSGCRRAVGPALQREDQGTPGR
jgi:hypothetical protein